MEEPAGSRILSAKFSVSSYFKALLNALFGAFVVLNFEEIRNTAKTVGKTTKTINGRVNNSSVSYAVAA